MEPVRVLQVIDEVSLNSGVCSMLFNYYRNIDHEKVNFDFMVFRDVPEDVAQLAASHGSHIYKMPALTGRNIVSGKLKREVDALLESKGDMYHIIHGHEPNASFVYLKCAKKHGISHRIVHSHNARGADSVVRKVRNYMLHKLGLLYANEYCACSKKAARYLYGTEQGVRIVNNAIEIERYAYNQELREQMREELCQNYGYNAQENVIPNLKDAFILGHVGRFVPQKNHGYLMDIMSQLVKDMPEAVLLLIGEGDDFEAVKRKVQERSLTQHVIFMGQSSRVKEYLQAMDAFLLPSLYEGLPVVGVEAQAAGLPCIVSTEVTQEAKILDTFSYVGIGTENVGQWCDRIKQIATQPETVRAAERADAAKLVADAGYDIKKESVKLEEFYRSLVNS